MRELTDPELYQALEYARDLDDTAAGEIIERFHLDQTALAQTLFEVFLIVIAEQDQDMAQLFMSLCFDVICVFQKAFGPLPPQNEMGFDWLEKQAMLLDAEFQSLMTDRNMDEKIRHKLQDRFLQRSIEDSPQMGLVRFTNAAIDDFASESPNRVKAIRTIQTMIFVAVRLLGNLYSMKI
ncbi:hypothetical protein [Methylobacter sp. YRD-M1]|uniref:hypothetical protein n=1 Tax=Methylobacter sp. YRD-M1 TaxID=2911520 RepID=UPI00227D398C|nr:hypothetical protein [Methylobacter sp. YRD-M1]WAK04595.1 hypothetical protein LZ558_22330 [Methylobacter sp. YRD-M1]